jgi:diacylglycerol kinase family enzyme
MPVELQVDGKTIKENVLMLVFCNTREFGNGADISPSSKPDDGFAELRLVRKPPFLPLIKAFYDIYTHRADGNPYLTNIPATQATVKQGGTMAHLDGEPLEVGHEVRFRLEAAKLLVVA